MLKNNKGVTLAALILTVIVMIILTGVSITTGYDVVKDVRAGRILSNMDLIEGKMSVIYDDYKFYNDASYIEGQGPIKINSSTNKLEEITLSNEELTIIANKAGVSKTAVYSWNWYKWESAEFDAQNLDKAMLEKGTVFFVNYENNEIIYSKGTSYDNVLYYYSKTGLNDVFKSDRKK